MLKRALMILVIAMMVGVSTGFPSMALGSAYSENFSTDPGWTTNDASLFYWNSGDGTYAATQVNVNGGGNYSYYDVGHDGSSFVMEWDIILHSVDYASGLTFGMFDTDLDTQTASCAKVEFTHADQGLFAVMSYIDAGGNSSHTDYISTPPAQFSLDTWYRVRIHYNGSAGTMTAEVAERTTGQHFTSLSLSGLSSLGSDVGYVGSSNVRAGNFQVPGAQTVGKIDNVRFMAPNAYYPFNGNANDESGNGHHGTVTGATLCTDRFGIADSAYSFDGDDCIEVPNSPTATTYVDFSAWVRLDAEGDRDGGYILCKGKHLVPETYSIVVTDTDHFPQVRVHVDGGYYIAESTVGLVLGEWTHIEGIYDGVGPDAGLTLYVNGNSMDYVAVSGTLDQNSESLYFGCDYGNSLTTWEGDVDDVSITVPEPATLSLLVLGGLAVLRKRRGR